VGDAAPALLVPLTLEALTLVEASRNQAWSWARPNYRMLRTYQSVDARPFDPSPPILPGPQPFTGAVLHWALPDGVTHGFQPGPNAQISYPAAPNRWLVIRTAPDPGDLGRWQSQAWVVASDVENDPDGSPYPNAATDGATTLGRSWPLADWPGEAALEDATLARPLSAVGPGDATYAAYVPNVSSVFAFADPLTGLSRGPVSYEVLGWYSDARLDPLYGFEAYGPDGWPTVEAWCDLMNLRRWSVGDEADLDRACAAAAAWAVAHGQTVDPARPHTTHPARTLCHGLLTDMTWLGPSGPIYRSVPTADPQAAGYVRPTVAVGHNALDALAATIAQSEADRLDPEAIRQLVDILQALEHDDLALLDAPDAQARLDLTVQQAWFTSTAGGTEWTVAPAGDVDDPSGRSTPVLDAAQTAALTDLDRRQADLDRTARALASAQATFASAWWKVSRLTAWIPPPPPPSEPEQQATRAALDAARSGALAEIGAYRYARQARDAAFIALRRELNRAAAALEIRSRAEAPFAAPTDPVLLISGAHRSFKHGEDDRFGEDGTLFCRFTGQTVDGIEVDVDDGQKVLVDAAKVPSPVFDYPDLPPELPDLVAEGFFLDTGSAPFVATVARPSDPWPLLGRIRREQTLVWNPAAHPALDVQTIAELSGLHFLEGRGALPSKVGVTLWTPPWSPLFVDWSVTYYPGQLPATRSLEPWTPPADRVPSGQDDLTYTWRSGRPPITGSQTSVQGRTLLTPQATDLLATRLRQTIEAMGDTPVVQDDLWALLLALDHVSRADVLSQAMSGFGDALLQQFATNFRIPADGSLDPYLRPAGAPSYVPVAIPAADADNDAFNPIRAGHLRLDRLCIVDGFGQVFDVLGAMHVTPSTITLIPAPDLVTAEYPALGELKPRLAQPCRLRVDWLDADNDDRPVRTDAEADPVCGWFVLNYLDRGVLVYAPDGTPLGEVVTTADAARWLPAPEHAPPPHGGVPPIDIPNAHVRAVVAGIVERPDSRNALVALINLIHRATWTVEPSGGWTDEELPVLIGRPLAVARAGLRLELVGAPAIRQTWADSNRNDSDGFTTVSFPVQLGSTELLDGGLVGFYLDDDATHINTVIGLLDEGEDPAATTDYVAHGRPEVRPAASGGALLTLLLDPHSTVHAITGVLPVTSATLPPGIVDGALARLAVTFRTGPVLGNGTGVTMPLPALHSGTWSWLEYDGTTTPARSSGVGTVGASAALLDALPMFREGWLRLLLHGAPTRFAYEAVPSSVPCTVDPQVPSTAALQLSVYNPTGEREPYQRITWTLPVGDGAGDLASSALTLAARVLSSGATRWTARVDGPHVIVEPVTAGDGLAAGETVIVLAAGIPVNQAPGVATITVAEVTDTTRSGFLAVSKVAAKLPGGERERSRDPMSYPPALFDYTFTPDTVPCSGTSPSKVDLMLAVANGTGRDVICQQIGFTITPGERQGDLTDDVSNIASGVTLGTHWTPSSETPGSFAWTPDPGHEVLHAGESVAFLVTNVTVNDVPGLVELTLYETTDVPRQMTLKITKRETTLGITSFTAVPVQVNPGQSTMLTWTTTGADHCTLTIGGRSSPVPLDGTQPDEPVATTTYTLTAEGKGTSISAQLTVVVPEVRILDFRADPDQLPKGASTRLSWIVLGASRAVVNPGRHQVAPDHGTLDRPVTDDTTFILVASSPTRSDSQERPVDVMPVEITSFAAAPAVIALGNSATLSWATRWASGCTIDPGIGPADLSGSEAVKPPVSTTYRLRADGRDPREVWATVGVGAAVTAFGVTADSSQPDEVIVSWATFVGSTGTVTLAVTGGGSPSPPTPVAPTGTKPVSLSSAGWVTVVLEAVLDGTKATASISASGPLASPGIRFEKLQLTCASGINTPQATSTIQWVSAEGNVTGRVANAEGRYESIDGATGSLPFAVGQRAPGTELWHGRLQVNDRPIVNWEVK
jgi:hypothetical protein